MEDCSASGITPSVLKNLQVKYGVKASKALGQNFLVDPNICEKIARILPKDENALEIGPGIGSLTVQLAKRANRVTAIELDKHLLAPLENILTDFKVADKVDVINDDIMRTNMEVLCSRSDIKYVFGNLPYNISAPLLADIAQLVPSVKCVVAMVQKEVGQRLSAKQGTRQVGAITYKCQHFMEIESLFEVPKMSFIPRPHVDSIVIKMVRKELDPNALNIKEIGLMFNLIDTAFSQRRKMLRQSLKTLLGEQLSSVFADAGIDSALRPEQLKNDDFMALFLSWKKHGASE